MIARPEFFLLALVLLWLPRSWLRRGKTLGPRRRARRGQEPWKRHEPGDPRMSFRQEFGKVRNWVDLARAAAGSLAIFGGHGIAASVQAVEDQPRGGLYALGVQVTVMFIGLAIQIVRNERGRPAFFAPVFYLAGAAVGMCGGWGALFAFVLVWGVNPMLANAAAFLLVQGLSVGVFGFMMRGVGTVRPLLAGVLCLTPALLSLLLRRPLVVFSRRPGTSGAEAS